MFKNLLIKFLGLSEVVEENNKLKMERAEKAQATIDERNKNSHIKDKVFVDDNREEKNRENFKPMATNQAFDRVNGDWLALQRNNRELSQAILMELSSRCFATAPELICEIAEDYSSHILESYYIRLLNQAGQFDKEKDNVESLSKTELVEAITELSINNYVNAMKAKSLNSSPSEKMMDMLKRNGVDTSKVKTYKYAKILIEDIIASADPTPGENQLETISRMVEKLGLQGEDEESLSKLGINTKTKKDCSESIKVLIKMCDDKFGDLPPSEAQIETYKRYLKMNNKRITKAIDNKIAKMNNRMISEEIRVLKETYAKEHPYASEGQVNFIMSLSNQLFLNVNKNDVEKLTPQEATAKIRNLQEELLYCKALAKGVSMPKSYIKTLSKDELKEKLDELSGKKKELGA
ncbi:MAG: hypothetical protein ACRC2K_13405 [Clostridium sp.]